MNGEVSVLRMRMRMSRICYKCNRIFVGKSLGLYLFDNKLNAFHKLKNHTGKEIISNEIKERRMRLCKQEQQ